MENELERRGARVSYGVPAQHKQLPYWLGLKVRRGIRAGQETIRCKKTRIAEIETPLSPFQKPPTQPLDSAQNFAIFTSLGRLMKISTALVSGVQSIERTKDRHLTYE